MDEASTYRVLNREIFLLIALSVGAVGVYAFTKSMAAKEQQMDARIAAISYEEGQSQFSSRQIDQGNRLVSQSNDGCSQRSDAMRSRWPTRWQQAITMRGPADAASFAGSRSRRCRDQQPAGEDRRQAQRSR